MYYLFYVSLLPVFFNLAPAFLRRLFSFPGLKSYCCLLYCARNRESKLQENKLHLHNAFSVILIKTEFRIGVLLCKSERESEKEKVFLSFLPTTIFCILLFMPKSYCSEAPFQLFGSLNIKCYKGNFQTFSQHRDIFRP